MCPRNAIVIGAWFLTREIELACSRACLSKVCRSTDSVEWCLPASKTDSLAESTARTHFCICRNGRNVNCPACTMLDQHKWLRILFRIE